MRVGLHWQLDLLKIFKGLIKFMSSGDRSLVTNRYTRSGLKLQGSIDSNNKLCIRPWLVLGNRTIQWGSVAFVWGFEELNLKTQFFSLLSSPWIVLAIEDLVDQFFLFFLKDPKISFVKWTFLFPLTSNKCRNIWIKS